MVLFLTLTFLVPLFASIVFFLFWSFATFIHLQFLRFTYSIFDKVNAILENKRKELMRVNGVDREEDAIILAQVGSTIGSDDSSAISTSSKDVNPLVSQVIEASASSA